MKKIIVAVALIMGFAVNAQTKEKKVTDKAIAPIERRATLTPEERADIRVKRFTTELTLTEKQQKELRPVFVKIENERQVTLDANKANKKAGIKLTEEEKNQRKIKALEQKTALDKEFKKILNKEQFEKYESVKEEKKENLKKNKQTQLQPAQK